MNAVGWVGSRRKPRFSLRNLLSAALGLVPARVVDISSSGARVEGREKPQNADVQELTFESPVSHAPFALPARVVWTRLERSSNPGELVYHAGVEFLGGQDDAERAIAELVSARLAYPKDSLFDTATPDHQAQLLKIRKAADFFAANPDEIRRWADYAIAQHIAESLPDRDRIFAVWEYLDRKVDLELVKEYFRSLG